MLSTSPTSFMIQVKSSMSGTRCAFDFIVNLQTCENAKKCDAIFCRFTIEQWTKNSCCSLLLSFGFQLFGKKNSVKGQFLRKYSISMCILLWKSLFKTMLFSKCSFSSGFNWKCYFIFFYQETKSRICSDWNAFQLSANPKEFFEKNVNRLMR